MNDQRNSHFRSRFPSKINVGEAVFRGNIEASVRRDLPWLTQAPAHNKKCVLVAGGPSLADSEWQLQRMVEEGRTIFALNNTARWLLERAIVPAYHVILDARAWNTRFIAKYDGTTYLLASQCAPEVFDAAGPTILWHPSVEGIMEFVGERETALIAGGTTVGLCALSIAYALGYRDMHLIGYDSSYRDGEGHAYKQPENDNEGRIDVLFAGRKFTCARWMVAQVEDFKETLHNLVEADCTVTVGGDGYLQETVRQMVNPKRHNIAVVFGWQGENTAFPTAERAALMIASVRQNMPHARIIQLTNETFPACPGVDHVLRTPNTGDFAEWGMQSTINMLCSELTHDCTGILQIATDVVLQQDVTTMFDGNFDVAACRYPKYTRGDGAYCGDVRFLKRSAVEFFEDALTHYRYHPEIQDGWEGSQTAFLAVVNGGRHKVMDLDFNTFCRTPESADENVSDAAIVHYRGPRKAWMTSHPMSRLGWTEPTEAAA